MGMIRYIAAFILSAVTLVSFTGVLLYKDVCTPCGSSQVYLYVDFSEKTCNCDNSGIQCDECCDINAVHHDDQHSHNHQVHFKKLSNYFIVSTPKLIAKPYARLVALFSFETTTKLLTHAVTPTETAKLPPDFDFQSFVCILLI